MKSVISVMFLGIAVFLAQPVFAAGKPADKPAQAAEKSLYERLGGVFAIAAVVDHFSDAVVKGGGKGEAERGQTRMALSNG